MDVETMSCAYWDTLFIHFFIQFLFESIFIQLRATLDLGYFSCSRHFYNCVKIYFDQWLIWPELKKKFLPFHIGHPVSWSDTEVGQGWLKPSLDFTEGHHTFNSMVTLDNEPKQGRI